MIANRQMLNHLHEVAAIVKRADKVIIRKEPVTISAGFSQEAAPCVDSAGNTVAASPAAGSSDDDGGGDGDPDPARRRKRPSVTHPSPPPALLALPAVLSYLGLSRSRVYELIRDGQFPLPVKIGKSARWVRAETDQWLAKQIAARPSNQRAAG